MLYIQNIVFCIKPRKINAQKHLTCNKVKILF